MKVVKKINRYKKLIHKLKLKRENLFINNNTITNYILIQGLPQIFRSCKYVSKKEKII